MIVTTTDVLQGMVIQDYLGIVTAEVVYGTNAEDFFKGLRDNYEQLFERGQRDALAELEQRAQRMGADAVIGIKIDTGTINIDGAGALLLINATGTAVKLQR